MNVGELWLNDPKKSLLMNIQDAAKAYQKKFNKPATLCLMHPALLNAPMPFVTNDKLTVSTWSNLPAGHFWIGCEDEPEIEQESGVVQ